MRVHPQQTAVWGLSTRILSRVHNNIIIIVQNVQFFNKNFRLRYLGSYIF